MKGSWGRFRIYGRARANLGAYRRCCRASQFFLFGVGRLFLFLLRPRQIPFVAGVFTLRPTSVRVLAARIRRWSSATILRRHLAENDDASYGLGKLLHSRFAPTQAVRFSPSSTGQAPSSADSNRVPNIILAIETDSKLTGISATTTATRSRTLDWR